MPDATARRGNFLCLARDFKGGALMRALHGRGHAVYLVTDEKNRGDDWPHEVIEYVRYVPARGRRPHDKQDFIAGAAWDLREHRIDRVLALDDFDVEDAALLREEFRLPGMGQTTARYFRDKLAMRQRARDAGIAVPAFSALFHRGQLERFLVEVPGPYVIKPRTEASAAGVTKVESAADALTASDRLGEHSYRYLIEAFAAGDVYHVDALTWRGEVGFARASAYGAPPLAIVQGGGSFQTRTLSPGSEAHAELLRENARLLRAFGLRSGASHTEFIRDAEGRLLFLETSSRVGGAYIANALARATGVDLWREWGLLAAAEFEGTPYAMPTDRGDVAAVVLRAIGDEWADVSGIDDPVVAEVIRRRYHVGFVLGANEEAILLDGQERVARWVASYGEGY